MHAHRPIDPSSCPTGRPRDRLLALAIAGAAGLGLLDLWWTADAMSSIGMHEANPIARLVAAQGLEALVAFKLSTIAIHGWLLWCCRSRLSAHVAAWLSLAVLVALLTQWLGYFEATRGLDPEALRAIGRLSPDWVEL